MQHTESSNLQNDDEISLVDIIRFFSHNWKFLALTTLGLSAIAITLKLTLPKPQQSTQYQQQLTLSVQPNSVPVSTFPLMNAHQVGALAAELLHNPELEEIIDEPEYTTTTQQVSLTVELPEADASNSTGTKIVNQLKEDFGTVFSETLEATLNHVETDIKRSQKILTQLEEQIAQVPKRAPTEFPDPRMSTLESQRSSRITTINSLEFDKQYLEKAQKNPTEFASQVVSVQIVSKSEMPQTTSSSSSLLQVAILAFIASFMVAILAAIIRNQIPRLKAELSQERPNSSLVQHGEHNPPV
ncbi:MAG: hypothetical protein F6K31_02935 [Symploca sp. SIO2G7]|nr:hypothetical protein [Symploca sp. SIO2G7]